MRLSLITALARRNLRRQIAHERARLEEMEHNAATLIGAQRERVARLEAPRPTARGIAHAIEMRAKAAVLA